MVQQTVLSWNFMVPRNEISPQYGVEDKDGQQMVWISGNGRPGSYGIWISERIPVTEKRKYVFRAEYFPEQIGNEQVSIYALATWMNQEGTMLQRDYIDSVEEHPDGWRTVSRSIDAPWDAVGVQIELALRWSENGKVTWRNISVQDIGVLKERVVRVATTYSKPTEDFDKNLALMCQMLDQAGALRPDIICLTETFCEGFVKLPLVERCQPIPGHLTRMVGEKAAEYGCYVIFTMYERDQEQIYNTAVLIGRNGHVVGKYRKMHLPLYEAEMGVMPGTGYGLFDTDFGRIGVLICYDQEFPEAARILALEGAELIFIPTIGDEPLQTRARARDNGIHVIVSGCGGPKSSRIVDPMGEIIAELANETDGATAMDIRLDELQYTYWLSVGAANGESRSLFKKERRTDQYAVLVSNSWK